MSMYVGKEVDIHPEFQRFFRWSIDQKSQLVESILLGIPIPSIFVAQRDDGVWHVIDGFQRLSTFFQLFGVLRNEHEQVEPPLVLTGAKYLPALKGLRWRSDSGELAFTVAQQLMVKRSKLGVSIVLRESNDRIKYDLFERLNTGGSPLSDQEVRNCILVMENSEFYRWVRELASDDAFQQTIAISDKSKAEQYDMELVLRFVLLRNIAEGSLRDVGDISTFISDRMISAARSELFDWSEEATVFREAFDLLATTVGGDAFRKFDSSRDGFTGGFSISAFEVVALGVGFNRRKRLDTPDNSMRQKVQEFWSLEEFRDHSGAGFRASQRLPWLVPLGRRSFAE